jgi:hypothetical protein
MHLETVHDQPRKRAGSLALGTAFFRSIHHWRADEPSPPGRIVVRRRDRGGPTAAHMASRTSANSILCIANHLWDLMPLRRDQKLFPHFGEAGAAVFAVEEVEHGGHDPTSFFELICTISCRLSFSLDPGCELGHSLFLLSFLRPQCGSFRAGLNSRTW